MAPTDDPQLTALAERLVELRQEKRYLEGEIERVSAELAEALGPGRKRTLGAIEVRVSAPRPGVRIVRAADVPAAFQSLQPDRKLLVAHLGATGEVPPGVEATVTRPIVYVKAPGAEDDAEGSDAGG